MKKVVSYVYSELNKKYELKWIVIGFLLGEIICDLLGYLLNQLVK